MGKTRTAFYNQWENMVTRVTDIVFRIGLVVFLGSGQPDVGRGTGTGFVREIRADTHANCSERFVTIHHHIDFGGFSPFRALTR